MSPSVDLWQWRTTQLPVRLTWGFAGVESPHFQNTSFKHKLYGLYSSSGCGLIIIIVSLAGLIAAGSAPGIVDVSTTTPDAHGILCVCISAQVVLALLAVPGSQHPLEVPHAGSRARIQMMGPLATTAPDTRAEPCRRPSGARLYPSATSLWRGPSFLHDRRSLERLSPDQPRTRNIHRALSDSSSPVLAGPEPVVRS